jgi:FKBP-type peptidyl-prolyl cis-trans isomerase (trigger factor)
MKLAVKKLDPVRWELKFEVPRERVSQKFDKIYEELGKVVKVRGFRQGKVPRHIMESQHNKLAREEVIKELIPEVYQEGLEKEKIKPIELPEILDVNFNEGKVTFTAKLDVKPEVKVSDYKKIKVTRKSSTVTPEELDKTLEFFKKGRGEGKEVTIDDAFAHGLGFPSLEEFTKSLTRQLEIDKDRHNRMDIENQVAEHLLKKAKLTTPPSLVKKQLSRRLEDIHQRLSSQGLSQEDIKKKEDEIRPQIEESVEKDTRIYLVLDKIAELENIPVKEDENLAVKVMEFLLKEAEWEEAK